MNDSELKQLCLSLIHADSEESVIQILKNGGYWDNADAWRDFGDEDDNFSTFSNQSSRPEYALTEKITNSFDAILINECWKQGVNPKDREDERVPGSLKQAVMQFFDKNSKGYLVDWPKQLRQETSKRITLSMTGAAASDRSGRSPCITIVDDGEGQTPSSMTNTILSIHKGNKKNIPFAQGQYNQGGTGALEFCGRYHLQLVVSRRNPNILPSDSADEDSRWSFTIVRRVNPGNNERNFKYTYLAPISIKGKELKELLSFSEKSMPLFPTGTNPYSRDTEWGTLIKLYEYKYQKTGMALGTGGLLYRLRLLLPDAPLPFTMYEFRTKKRNNYQPVSGLSVLLEENPDNLEEDFPITIPLNVPYYDEGYEKLSAKIYAFKKGQYKAYKRTEGILYSYNGQVHHHVEDRVFRNTKKIGHDFIAKELLVVLDCSDISQTAKADLLMSSRDRTKETDFSIEVEERLYYELKTNEALKELRNRRQEEAAKNRIADTKPLEEILSRIIKGSDVLSSLLSTKEGRLSSAFKKKDVKAKDIAMVAKDFPTYFHFKKYAYGRVLKKDAHIGERTRIFFETDAEQNYFNRRNEPGNFELFIIKEDGQQLHYGNYSGPHIYNGVATLNLELPPGSAWGDVIGFRAVVSDVMMNNFTNDFFLNILAARKKRKVTTKRNKQSKPPSIDEGTDKTIPQSLAPPRPELVYEKDWEQHNFNKYSVLRISAAGEDEGVDHYKYYLNMDNEYLLYELKSIKDVKHKQAIVKNQYMLGMVLIGLALIRQHKSRENGDGETNKSYDIVDIVSFTTEAMAPFIIPMLKELGSIDLTDWEEDVDTNEEKDVA